GNDGLWSSFSFQTGNPPQIQKLLISTSSRNILLVSPSGCTSSDPPDCATLRGGIFDTTKSSTWIPNLDAGEKSTYPISSDPSLGYGGTGEFGFDEFVDTFTFLPLLNQSIVTITEKEPYIGFFGICPRPTTLPGSSVPIKSYLENLRENGTIPSLSWSYTSGGPYRKGTQSASLVLGGYDQARFTAHEITWSFDKNELRDLTVKLESITSFGWGGDRDQKSLLPAPISAFLDSSLPYIWLPLEACLLFEKEFGLVWDAATELYLVNDTLHDALLATDPSVTFGVNNGTDGFTVNITLPYAAFDLPASRPLVQNSSRYFPLKRANSTTQYILGRTFFQEAYVIADYERLTFSVHQCKGVANFAEDIWPIYSLNETAPDPNVGGTSTDAGIIDGLTPSSTKSSVGPAVGGTIGGVA
ncbi:aspartic peptidase domain-containing protein, partial [Cadophora sp. MPI-SDFR-AT-0126]